MTRKKVKLELIANEYARKTTFKKRMQGLMKKMDEISTLCDVEACAIIYSSYDPEPHVWPSPWGVQRVLSRFMVMPELDQTRKMVNQEIFLEQRIMKAKEQLKKQQKGNKEKEMRHVMLQCLIDEGNMNMNLNNMSMIELKDLAWLIDQNLNDINRKMEELDINAQMTQSQAPMVALATPDGADRNNGDKAQEDHGQHLFDGMQKEQWFMDLMNHGHDDGDEALQFGDVNQQNGFWPNNTLLP